MRPRWWMAVGLFLFGAAQIVPRRPWRRASSPAASVPPTDLRAPSVSGAAITMPVSSPVALTAPFANPPVVSSHVVPKGDRVTKEARPVVKGTPSLWVWLGYPLAILVAEMTVGQSTEQGIEIHLVLLATLVCHAMLTASWDRPLLLALSLVPVARIAGLAASSMSSSGHYWYLLSFAPLLLAGIVVSRMNRLSRARLGIRAPSITVQVAIALLGIPLGVVWFLILRPPEPQLPFSIGEMWMPALILMATAGFVEEFIFRGVLQGTATAMLGRVGILYATVAFAMLRIGDGSLLDVAFTLLVGLLFAWLVADTGSILGVSVARGLATVILLLIMPFVSWQVSIGQLAPPLEAPVSQPAEVAEPPTQALPSGTRTGGGILPAEGPSPTPSPEPSVTPVPVVAEMGQGGGEPRVTPPLDGEPIEAAEPAPDPVEEPPADAVLGQVPEPLPPPTPVLRFDTERYSVQQGDSFFTIAVKHGATQDLLRSLNPGLENRDIFPGQTLVVPVGFPRKWEPYFVQDGETIGGLASSRGTTPDAVALVNHLGNEAVLEAGQQILLPPPRN